MKSARVILNDPAEPPFRGSPSVINAALNDTLRDLGYELSCLYGRRVWREPGTFLPLEEAQQAVRLRNDPPFDLEVRCNVSAAQYPLVRRGTQKNVLFFHALVGNPGWWLGNDMVDGYWCNSDYLARVVAALLATPDWQRGALLDPRAFAVAGRVTLPVPLLERPEGVLMDGPEALPRVAEEALAGDDVLGHCVAGKLDEKAVYATMLALNMMAAQGGIGRRFRLFVERFLYDGMQAALSDDAGERAAEFAPLKAALGALRMTIDDILIPVPRLAQSALFRLMRRCRFGLFYHWFPEPFGLHPLESVCLGCPIYTNGAGNLRFLLPEGHGIEVLESEGMATGNPAAYRAVAERIFRDAVLSPAAAAEGCRRGAEFVARTYNRDAMRRDVEARLAALAQPPAELGLDDTRVALGPLVRSWNPQSRRVVSDYRGAELSPEQAAALEEVVGRSGGEVHRDPALRERAGELFRLGVVALQPAVVAEGAG
jgi:hypothetical protein